MLGLDFPVKRATDICHIEYARYVYLKIKPRAFDPRLFTHLWFYISIFADLRFVPRKVRFIKLRIRMMFIYLLL